MRAVAAPAAPAPVIDDANVLEPLADDVERVEQTGQDDDRRAVLVVVEDGDVELVAQARSRSSKQRGAEMSSRLMPPKTGAIADTIRTISSASFVARQTGHASMPPNSLNRIAFPSMTGSAASGPMSPEPEHRGPVGHDSDRVLLDRQVPDLLRIVGDRPRDARDARRVGHREVVARLQRQPSRRPRASRPGGSGRSGRRRARPRPRRARERPRRCASMWPRPTRARVTSRTFLPCSTRTRSIESSSPPASPIASASVRTSPAGSRDELGASR